MLFKREIEKVKLESEISENEKRKAEREIEDLKNQLKKKMSDDNERLFQALQRQETLKNESQYDMPKKKNNPHQNVEVLRPERNEKMVSKKYIPQEQEQEDYYQSPKRGGNNNKRRLDESNVSNNEEGLQSLHGNSKKIPLNLPSDKLSMSQLSDFARETQYFKNDFKSPSMQRKAPLNINESIAEVDDEDPTNSRAISRNNNRTRER